MRKLAVILFLSLAFPAAAGVYKSMGPDGSVQYSDRPLAGSEPVRIDVRKETGDSEAPGPETERPGAESGPYEAFEVVIPEPNATIRNNEGEVQIGLLIDPALMPEHRLQLELDGQRVPGDAAGTQVILRGLSFGSHRVRALLVDQLDEIIATTPPVDFHLRKQLPEPALR
jgi:hypothetical protein